MTSLSTDALRAGNRFLGNAVQNSRICGQTRSAFNMNSGNMSVTNDPPTATPGTNGQISQIPGLSPSIRYPPEEGHRGRRTKVLDSDSDYVKLAKQGGHKGLLWHEEILTSKPEAYKPPVWFSSASGENSKPCEEEKNPGAFQPPEPPFGTDSMSAWERDDNSSNGKEKDNKVHDSQVEKLQSSDQYHTTRKFKKILFDKNPAPVSMSKLLSFGYAEDKKPTATNALSN